MKDLLFGWVNGDVDAANLGEAPERGNPFLRVARPKGGVPIVRARSALPLGRARLLPSRHVVGERN